MHRRADDRGVAGAAARPVATCAIALAANTIEPAPAVAPSLRRRSAPRRAPTSGRRLCSSGLLADRCTTARSVVARDARGSVRGGAAQMPRPRLAQESVIRRGRGGVRGGYVLPRGYLAARPTPRTARAGCEFVTMAYMVETRAGSSTQRPISALTAHLGAAAMAPGAPARRWAAVLLGYR